MDREPMRRLSRRGFLTAVLTVSASALVGRAVGERNALTSLFVQEGRTIALSLGSLVSTEVLRGILAPVGHGLWTAILGGVLFAGSRNGRLRITVGLIGTYVLVAILHGLWDSMGMIAAVLTAIYVAVPTVGGIWFGIDLPPALEAALIGFAFYVGGLAVLSLIGLGLLRRRWKEASP